MLRLNSCLLEVIPNIVYKNLAEHNEIKSRRARAVSMLNSFNK